MPATLNSFDDKRLCVLALCALTNPSATALQDDLHLSAPALLSRVENAYSSADEYADTGTFTLSIRIGETRSTDRMSFRTAYSRPGSFVFTVEKEANGQLRLYKLERKNGRVRVSQRGRVTEYESIEEALPSFAADADLLPALIPGLLLELDVRYATAIKNSTVIKCETPKGCGWIVRGTWGDEQSKLFLHIRATDFAITRIIHEHSLDGASARRVVEYQIENFSREEDH